MRVKRSKHVFYACDNVTFNALGVAAHCSVNTPHCCSISILIQLTEVTTMPHIEVTAANELMPNWNSEAARRPLVVVVRCDRMRCDCNVTRWKNPQ